MSRISVSRAIAAGLTSIATIGAVLLGASGTAQAQTPMGDTPAAVTGVTPGAARAAPPAGTRVAAPSASVTGHGGADLLARGNTGDLLLSLSIGGAGLGTFGPFSVVGTGWGGMSEINLGDVNGDGRVDLLARGNAGDLLLYLNVGGTGLGTFGTPSVVGTGWGGMSEIALGDINGDNRPVEIPGRYPLQATQSTVTVKWFDRSDNENGFEVFRRDANGAWQSVYRVPTRNVLGGDSDGTQDYTWVDTSTSLSGQCYRIAAYNDTNVGYSDEECTVRPDPNRFPQAVSKVAEQWGGLSSTNDGTGNLINFKKNSHLKLGSQTFGVDLNWGDTSLWRVEAQGGPRLMEGQAVALKVWGGGWLKHGHQNFGVDLQLSDTPVYEWYAIGGGGHEDEFTFAGRDLTSAVTFALWNSSANAYLVNGHQTWGIDLNWYTPGGGGTPPPPPPPPPPGVKHINILNCVGSPNFDPDRPRTISIWARDATAGAAFTRQGDAPTGWGGSSCTGQSFTFTPSTAGHVYQVLAVDYNGSGCTAGDAPNMGCNVLEPFTFTADPTRGVDLPITIS